MKNALTYVLDDFGLSPAIDRRLVSRLDPTSIDRVAVVTNLSDITEFVPWLSRVPMRDIHLNATEPSARTSASHWSWKRRAGFVLRYLQTQNSVDRIESEWQSQIETFVSMFGHAPDGINSHEHIHFFPPLFERVCALAAKYGIPYVRLGENLTGMPGLGPRDVLYRAFHTKNNEVRLRFRLQTSPVLVSADNRLNEHTLHGLPAGTEVILHPDMSRDLELLGPLL